MRFKKIMMLLLFSISFNGVMAEGLRLNESVARINSQTSNDRSLILEITSEDVLGWYNHIRLLQLTKERRVDFDEAFSKGFLPENFQIIYMKFPEDLNIKPRLELQGPLVETGNSVHQENYTLANGLNIWNWDKEVLPMIQHQQTLIKESLRLGQSLPPSVSGEFPASVPVRISEIKLSLANPKTDVAALEIEFFVNAKNFNDIVNYFGVSYERDVVALKIQNALGMQTESWIGLKDILLGWPAKWVNRFPKEKTEEEGAVANDVCHGTARQFFSETLLNGSWDRSTEATEWLLKSSYTLLKGNVTPQFGDYLYKPGSHSIRFILKDPNTGRWIGFSSYSSWNTAYRVWWVDQDFDVIRFPPLPPVKGFEDSFDVWRPIK